MKNVIKIVSIILISCLSFFNVSADAGVVFNVPSNEKNVVVLKLDRSAIGPVKVQIYDPIGVIIYSEDIHENASKERKYNLKNLDAGEYTFTVDYNVEIKIQKVTKSLNEVILMNDEELTVYKPSFITENNKLGINLLSFNGAFEITIFDINGNTIYNENHSANGAFKSSYDLNQLEKGIYFCNVYIDSEDYKKSFYKEIEVK